MPESSMPGADVPVFSLTAGRLAAHHGRHGDLSGLCLDRVGSFLHETLALMFPHFCAAPRRESDLVHDLKAHSARLAVLLRPLTLPDGAGSREAVADAFVAGLPDIADACLLDGRALLEGDPAAESLEEVILSYPGFYAVAAYRIAHALIRLEVPLLPRLITEYAHQRTGIDIHPRARIGKSFFIDHGTGVVIGGTAVIGDNVKLYQGVTLGALRVDGADRTLKRHPTIEDNVVVYASATILGGDTIVGRDSVIGGNVWLTRSVPPRSRIMFRACDTEVVVPIDSREEA